MSWVVGELLGGFLSRQEPTLQRQKKIDRKKYPVALVRKKVAVPNVVAAGW